MAILSKADWPQEVRGPVPILPRDPRARYQSQAAKAAAKRAARPGNSLAHLAMVRQLWCSLGRKDDPREAIHVHHLQGGPCRKLRGLGMRSPDAWTVPLVWWRHDELHRLGSRHEYEYFMDNSAGRVDPYALALALKSISPDLRLAVRILQAHQTQSATVALLSLRHAELGRCK